VLGANARYWIINWFETRFGMLFPYGTLFINITGSFLLGLIMAFLGARLVDDPTYRLLLGTGFLGAYTTFSTFSYDTVLLLERGDFMHALANVLLSAGVSVGAAYLGVLLGRAIA
jgi:CrcB protein